MHLYSCDLFFFELVRHTVTLDLFLLVPGKETADAAAADQSTSPSKPQKLISLQYNLSDSEDEETRDERKARIVSIETYAIHRFSWIKLLK